MARFKKQKKLLLTAVFLVAIAAVAAGVYFFLPKNADLIKTRDITELYIDDHLFKLKTPRTDADKEKGLAGIEALGENEGMLFVMNEPGMYSFWMKDMKISIDILWVDESLRIVHGIENLKPDSYPVSYQNPVGTHAKYIIELRSGTIDRLKITADSVIKQ